MEFSEKLQELRKSKNMTQAELASSLFVSRAAVSKWESGRGLPSIDSLKAIGRLFHVSVDDLLSGEEILLAAQGETREKVWHLCAALLGLFDLMHLLFLFLPLFGEDAGGTVRSVSLLALSASWSRTLYLALFALTVLFGAVALVIQNVIIYQGKLLYSLSITMDVLITSFAVLNRQPYVAFFALWILIAKAVFYVKQR